MVLAEALGGGAHRVVVARHLDGGHTGDVELDAVVRGNGGHLDRDLLGLQGNDLDLLDEGPNEDALAHADLAARNMVFALHALAAASGHDHRLGSLGHLVAREQEEADDHEEDEGGSSRENT